MTELYLSRVSLKPDVDVGVLARTLLPADEADLNADHRAIWSLFADPEVARDFLWRKEARRGLYYVLSHRTPTADSPVFAVETRSFDPDLRVGDRLAFHLRVNATVARKQGSGRGKRHDIAMDLIRDVAAEDRAALRHVRAEEAIGTWLADRAEGYALEHHGLESYRAVDVPRKGKSARFGVFDVTGVVRVTDPGAFLAQIGRGFGRARAFGCGLMLVRRAA